jgi:START domain
MKFPSLLFLLLLFARLSTAQNNWTLQKEKDGIRISNRHSQTSPFNDIRVELDLTGNIDQLAVILMDVNDYKNWSYATKVSTLTVQQGPGSLIYYTEIEVPWPATNRCFYARFDLKKDPVAQTMMVSAVNLPDYKPIAKDLVQVPLTKGTWRVTTVNKKLIHVDYTLELNPGGSLPAWMLNLFSTKGPMESFENIKNKMTALNQ